MNDGIAQDFSFTTKRLSVRGWHTVEKEYPGKQWLPNAVQSILTPAVTRELPLPWQGNYTLDRAKRWIAERVIDSLPFIVIEKENGAAIGFVILAETEDDGLRIGYMLSESSWGKGLASELVEGLVQQCTDLGKSYLVGGVNRSNLASQRVLEKNGFSCLDMNVKDTELLFKLALQ